MLPLSLIVCLGILVIYILYSKKRTSEDDPSIPTYRCHTCDEEDCICTLEEESDDK